MKYAFMIAATGSGAGKTTITCAILGALKNKYGDVRAFKCGPDYIDPLFHKSVLGIPSKNLDVFFTGEENTKKLFYENNDSDVSVVEGVMGLYDGIDSNSYEGSSYHLASVLGIPVILVVDAHGMGRSLLAVIRGFLDMDDRRIIKGVILNRISKGYYQTIKPIIEQELKISVWGFFPKQEGESISSRYLGLKLPSEIENLKDSIDKAAKVISENVDIESLVSSAGVSNKGYSVKIGNDSNFSRNSLVRIAIAKDEAFCFYYEDNLKLLKEAGAELVEFSPLHDKRVPDDIDGIILGGGYPELHAGMLSANESMRQSIKECIIDKGVPSLAECGGFMYLHDKIRNDEGSFNMLGLIPGECYNTGKLVRFGYVNINDDGREFIKENVTIKAHEFHYYDSSNNGADATASKPTTARSWKCAHIIDNHWWGFAHLYYESNHEFPRSFVNKCIEHKKGSSKGE